MTTDTDHDETWTYAGQRLLANGKLVNAWRQPDADDLVLVDFGVKAAVGTTYTVTVTGDGKFRLGAPADWRSFQPPPADWIAAHETSKAMHAREAVERRIARESGTRDLDRLDSLTLAELRSQLLACRRHAERTALLAIILQRLGA